ncbi:MAG TPA: phosphatase PAP2-related protein [Chitinophaga sp.]|uniref:phosphatase PAP2-related protein n=1 Tax=Chitinophaga sp. TaxID=1869181 RepID=UPI002DBC0372|nr:phosphatase PAP2-related protein [Chitinophaga sp.]HEU4552401.1 phosphatase PAP2-related protein [Chitinophaga sp.]
MQLLRRSWQISWGDTGFKKKMIAGSITLVLIFLTFPSFFRYIEKRDGAVLNDWILACLPAIDVSIPIMIGIWGVLLLFVIRATGRPRMFLTFVTAYILLCVSRCLTIYLVPLSPPVNMIALTDPLTSVFYGGQSISKDLFYSGHTSLLALVYFCSVKKPDRLLAGICTVLVGILLLVQHVHYTTDVVFAPLFAWMAHTLANKWVDL